VLTQEQAVGIVGYLNRAGLLQAVEGAGAVWRDALWGVRFEDAQEGCRALVRRAGGPRFVVPGDLLFEVRKIRAGRIGNRVPPAPPGNLPEGAWAVFGREYVRALGDGLSEADADAAACRAVGVVREAVEPADPARLRELLGGALKTPEGG
jgi:hypothetical protein